MLQFLGKNIPGLGGGGGNAPGLRKKSLQVWLPYRLGPKDDKTGLNNRVLEVSKASVSTVL